MAAPKKVDYEQIEPGWRAGIKSPPQLAADYTAATGISVSHTAIKKHFAKLGVPRDLAAKVKAKADSMVLESMVTGKVSTATTKHDAQIIDESATLIATVRLSQRNDIQRARAIVNDLMGDLEAEAREPGLFREIQDLLSEKEDGTALTPAERAKVHEGYQKALSLGARVANMKALAEALRILIALERQAFGIDDAAGDDTAAAKSFLEAMLEARARI
jgi:predicted GNAT family acetyltransferase